MTPLLRIRGVADQEEGNMDGESPESYHFARSCSPVCAGGEGGDNGRGHRTENTYPAPWFCRTRSQVPPNLPSDSTCVLEPVTSSSGPVILTFLKYETLAMF